MRNSAGGRRRPTGMITTAVRILARSAMPALLASLLLLSFPGEARACSCAPVTTAEVVASAEIVFVGEEIFRDVARQTWPPVAVTFSVAEAYKGSIGSEITVWTGQGGGDCGLGPTRGLVGITAYTDGDGVVSVDSCGSLHDAEAVAALLEPIPTIGAAPESSAPDGGSGLPWASVALTGVAGVALVAVVLARRRRDDWHDGWSSSA